MFICLNFFISPVSLSKTWSLLHPRTEVPEDRHGMEVALGQWHRAVLRQWAAPMVLDCRKDQLQGQQANPTRFSLPLWIKGLGWKEKTPAGGGGVSCFAGLMPSTWPLCWGTSTQRAGAGAASFFLTFPEFGSASCQKYAKVLCAPYLRQHRGK